MSGSDWGRRSKSCYKTPLGSMAVSTAWQISRGPATSSTTGVWNVFVILRSIYQEQKKWWENVIFTIRVLSRLTAVLTWAASLGWTSAVTCCNIYREYHVPVVFEFLHHTRTYIDFARLITHQIVFHMKCNQIQLSYYVDGSFCSILIYSV